MSETFGRGQVMWAVWQLFLHVRYDAPERDDPTVPSEFNARVKKLWEFGIPIPESERPGTGTSVEYSYYHGFELAVAMKLIDMGLGQGTVGRFVNGNRRLLQRGFKRWEAEGEPLFIVFADEEIQEGNPMVAKGFRAPIWVNLNMWSENELIEDLKTIRGRGMIVVEVGRIAARVVEYLGKAPKIRRGRP